MSIYEFIIKDKAGNVLATLDGAKGRGFNIYLNKSGDASFNISPTDPKLTPDLLLLGSKELYIYRKGTLVWGGELQYRRTDYNETSENVTVTAKGFFDLLTKKITGTSASPRVFSNTDLSTIAWTLINEAQTGINASFGIQQGALATSRNADRSYEYKTLKDAIEGLSNLNVQNGFDFEIDANKQFSTYYPTKGRQRADIVYELGKNILSFSEIQDATEMANEIIVLGAGQGVDLITVTRDSVDPTIQGNYKIRQKTVSYKDDSQIATLNDNGDKELSNTQVQQQILSLKTRGDLDPVFGSFSIGDSIHVIIKYGITQIDSYFRVYGIKVKISDEDLEDVELIFNPT